MISQLLSIIPRFPNHRVLVVGDVMLDEYVWGEVHRVSSEAPVPIVNVNGHTYRAGGAANTAANVAALGGNVLLAGIVGQDPQAEHLRACLADMQINYSGVATDAARPTTTKTRIVSQNQQLLRIDVENVQALDKKLTTSLLAWIHEHLSAVDACVLSDYQKGVVTPEFAQKFITMARDFGKPIVVDPKGADFQKYRRATIITPNTKEASLATGRDITEESSLCEAGQKLLGILGDDGAVLITRGAEGMTLFQHQHEPIHVPARAHNVFDVTGAGDTVVSLLALGLATGASLADSMQIANVGAGIVVSKFGTSMVSLDELVKQVQHQIHDDKFTAINSR